MRAERLGALRPRLLLVSEYSIGNVLAHVASVEPDLLIVDSIQTLHDPEIPSAPGSVVQVRECASRLVQEAKARGMSVVLVGHVTKDGGLAGPRTLEHLVDTVLSFEGDRHHALRVLRAVKHRFGSTLEVGLFEMSEQGLDGVPDPSELFLADRRRGVAGSVVVPTIDGQRPLLVEVQALVAPSPLPTPRRSVQGVDSRRLALLLAVLGRRAGIWCNQHDVYGLAVGGAQVVEPGGDLALALALASAVLDRPVPEDLVAVGEVGLAGELRQVGNMPRRLAEAARMGFRRAIVPFTSPAATDGLEVIRAGTLSEALLAVGCRP
jgi:DNA repair protein RadA/Sms